MGVEIRVLLKGKLEGVHPLEPGKPLVVGRGEDTDVRLFDRATSRRHAQLELTVDGLVVEDLGSSGGTLVGDERIPGAIVCALPCQVAIGKHVLEIGWSTDRPPSLWDDYEQGPLLGTGGFGRVFSATRRADGVQVAVKELAIYDDDLRQRVQREAELCAGLDHPNLVRLLDVRIEEAGLFQVLELVPGGQDLADRLIDDGALPIPEVLRIAREAAAGLQAIHEAGLVHRDVKPANLLFMPDGQVKIADFGLARQTASGNTLTQTAVGLGTPAYMDPQQAIDAKRVGPASDLYGLGATLYHAVTGDPPFESVDIEALLEAISSEEPPPISELRPECPEALAKIIHRLLAKEPAGRYASAKILLKRLAKVEV